MKVGLILASEGQGPYLDSINTQADSGGRQAQKKHGDNLTLTPLRLNKDGSNQKELLDRLASDGNGLIFSPTSDSAVVKSAQEHPDVTYAFFGRDALCDQHKNLVCLHGRYQEGSFLVGAAAALKSKSHIIGFIGETPSDGDTYTSQAGYQAGVAYIDKQKGTNTKSLVDYTEQAEDSTPNGNELALKQINQGADVIYHSGLGVAGFGIVQACTAKQKYAIGFEVDWSVLVDPLKGGYAFLGLPERAVDYAQNQYNKDLLADTPQALDDIKQKIINGEIKVPDKPTTR